MHAFNMVCPIFSVLLNLVVYVAYCYNFPFLLLNRRQSESPVPVLKEHIHFTNASYHMFNFTHLNVLELILRTILYLIIINT